MNSLNLNTTSALVLSCLLWGVMHSNPYNLVDVQKINPDIMLDIKYATKDNFTGQQVYSNAKCYLLKEVAEALNEAAKYFAQLGYTIKIWDGYRPHKVQYIFWHLVPDERYVANPEKGSKHNRGCAVDITLVDQHGKELDMGTDFDDFSEKAHRSYANLSETISNNRKLLENIMAQHNFIGEPTEWWHFDYKNWQNFPLLDVPFEELED